MGSSQPDCDETWDGTEHPVHYARRVALAKVRATVAALSPVPTHPVLAADTTVWIRPSGAPLGKPRDADELLKMLSALRAARRHHVTTAFALAAPNGEVTVDHITTHVHLVPPPADQLSAYISSDEWRDKAGGYAIQGVAGAWVSRVEGSYSSVVGLPVAEVVSALEHLQTRKAVGDAPLNTKEPR